MDKNYSDDINQNTPIFLDKITQSCIEEECKEDNLTLPSGLSIANTNRILEYLNALKLNYKFYHYVIDDGKITLESAPKKGTSLTFEMHSNGGVVCFFTFDGKSKMSEFKNIEDFLQSNELIKDYAFKINH